MRVLVHARSFAPGDARLAHAAAGLASRGHAVEWLGPDDPPGHAPTLVHHRGEAVPGPRAEVVVAGGRAILATTAAARLAGAGAMVLGVTRDEVRRWRAFDRWAWQSFHPLALIDEGEAAAWRDDALGLDPGQIALWSGEPVGAAPEAEHDDTEILERACERALARRRPMRSAVFVDRDGTLVREVGYLADPDDLHLLPGVGRALRLLRESGHPVIVISNQSGVGRGLFPRARVYEAMARLRTLLRAEEVELDAVYFCPHRPDAGCACRKPGIALLERAAEDQRLSLRHSVMIGDKLLDAATGQNAGGAGILVRTGYGRDEEQRIASGEFTRPPDAVCDDLAAAAEWWLARAEP